MLVKRIEVMTDADDSNDVDAGYDDDDNGVRRRRQRQRRRRWWRLMVIIWRRKSEEVESGEDGGVETAKLNWPLNKSCLENFYQIFAADIFTSAKVLKFKNFFHFFFFILWNVIIIIMIIIIIIIIHIISCICCVKINKLIHNALMSVSRLLLKFKWLQIVIE